MSLSVKMYYQSRLELSKCKTLERFMTSVCGLFWKFSKKAVMIYDYLKETMYYDMSLGLWRYNK